MILTQSKSFEEVLSGLDRSKRLFIVGCNVCAAKMKTGGEPEVLEMANRLTKAGFPVIGWVLPTAACSVRSFDALIEKNERIKEAEHILVMACGSGVSVISSVSNVSVSGSNDTLSLGGRIGNESVAHLCILCGNCNLSDFSGICPTARCPKSQMNGPCGGSKDGKCEVMKETECVWYLIEKRMDSLGMFPTLLETKPPKNHSHL
jgi:hypothetical protein